MCVRKLWGGMGFKKLRVFNLAILTKQGWRLFQNENSLLCMLLKAKYFSALTSWQLVWVYLHLIIGERCGRQQNGLWMSVDGG